MTFTARTGTAVGLATARKVPDLVKGDRLLLEALRARGVHAEPVIWDEPARGARPWDAVVIRSCWDYHLKPAVFLEWLARLEAAGIRVINSADIVRWNLHKRYLRDAGRAGARIPPTIVAAAGEERPLAGLIADSGWPATVMKPAISASGYRTRKVHGAPGPEDERAYDIMRADGDVLLQAYVPEVRDRGEWSLVFIDGDFSHAALKFAAAEEFRVQAEWGGRAVAAEPPADIVREARSLLHALAPGAVYARVDGVEANGGFTLMELELIEPELFLDQHPEAAARLADAVIGRMGPRLSAPPPAASTRRGRSSRLPSRARSPRRR